VPSTRGSDAKSTVIRLHPICSLVLASDAAYCDRVLRVVGDLGPVLLAITAEGQCGEPDDVLALVRRENPDVVVLDATGREAGVKHIATAIADTLPRVGVVIVCEHSTAAARQLGALPKWGWTQDLRDAVERAYADRRRRVTRSRPPSHPAAPAPRTAGPLAGWD
jgi:DNA-binding NarL/FixJ family response regulator